MGPSHYSKWPKVYAVKLHVEHEFAWFYTNCRKFGKFDMFIFQCSVISIGLISKILNPSFHRKYHFVFIGVLLRYCPGIVCPSVLRCIWKMSPYLHTGLHLTKYFPQLHGRLSYWLALNCCKTYVSAIIFKTGGMGFHYIWHKYVTPYGLGSEQILS